jgi:glycosyltransferase involved in cell wall biosynthesis
MTDISVVMPVYNGAQYLRESIESILNQTYKDFELLIFNDGSTDNSLEIIKSYRDERIITLTQNMSQGCVVHLNHGIKIAKGKYIARMDADDISMPERFEKQIDFLENNPSISLVGCFGYYIDSESKTTGMLPKPVGPDQIQKSCLYYGPHIHPTIMFRKKVIQKIGNYREKYLFVEDIDLYYRLIFAGYKTDNIPEYLFKYRVHPLSTNRFFKEKNQKSFQLKWETQKQFNLHYTALEIVSIYIHYILGIMLSYKQKTLLERFVKKFI